MNLTKVRISATNMKLSSAKVLNRDMKNFGKKQLFTLMNKNLTLPFQMIQL